MKWIMSAFADEAGPNVDDQIKALKRAGMNYIDLRSVESHNISELPLDVASEVKSKLDAAGIKVAMFGSPIGKIDIADDFQVDVDKLNHLGRLVDVLDCRWVRIFSYFNKQQASTDQWQAESLRRLRELKALAKELGMVLYHENESHIFGEKCAEVQIIADELRDDTFKMIFDFGNYIAAGEDVWQNWLKLRDTNDAIHLKERATDGQHVPVGTGAGYVPQILADALQRGWHGPLTLEPHLKHSKAVMATGPSGKPNESFAEMSAADCFHGAAMAAMDIVKKIGAPIE